VNARPSSHPGSEQIARVVLAQAVNAPLDELVSLVSVDGAPGVFYAECREDLQPNYLLALLDEAPLAPEVIELAGRHGQSRLLEASTLLDTSSLNGSITNCSPFLDPLNETQRMLRQQDVAGFAAWADSRRASSDYHFEQVWLAGARGEQILLAACLDGEACTKTAAVLGGIAPQYQNREKLLERARSWGAGPKSPTGLLAEAIASFGERRLEARLSVPLGLGPRSRPSGLAARLGAA
jgi:hypothetical protein